MLLVFRLLLAVLHFNENADRALKRNLQGRIQWNLTYPRGTGGEPTVRALKSDPTFGKDCMMVSP